MKSETLQVFNDFVNRWEDTEEKTKAAFLRFRERLGGYPVVSLDFIPREGLTYSLRGTHENQTAKNLFVMVDVIEDTPRWLSVCFYGEMITDPDEQGDFVPEGLLGEDAHCFDLEAWDDALIEYIEARLDEACAYASKG